MENRELNLKEISEKIKDAYSDKGKSEATAALDDFLDELLADIDKKNIKAPEVYKLLKSCIRVLLENMEYGYSYYEPLLNRCISMLYNVYLLDESYKDKIIRLLLDMHSEYNHYTSDYYRLVSLFLDDKTAYDAIDKAKKVKFGPDINLLIIAYDKLNISFNDRIDKLEKYIGRYGVTEYLFWLYYECQMPDRLLAFIEGNKDVYSFRKQIDIAYYYYYLLKEDKNNALNSIRRACLYDQDLKLYLEYVNDSSEPKIEMEWYYNNKSYDFLSKILKHYNYLDALMDVIIEADSYSLYVTYQKLLLPKYSDDYKSFLLRYLDRRVTKLNEKRSYERVLSVIKWILALAPQAEERLRALNTIYRDEGLVNEALDLIKELKK